MAKIAVAPLVGAWIEIARFSAAVGCIVVAPLVGAWIEIFDSAVSQNTYLGRSPRGSVD